VGPSVVELVGVGFKLGLDVSGVKLDGALDFDGSEAPDTDGNGGTTGEEGEVLGKPGNVDPRNGGPLVCGEGTSSSGRVGGLVRIISGVFEMPAPWV